MSSTTISTTISTTAQRPVLRMPVDRPLAPPTPTKSMRLPSPAEQGIVLGRRVRARAERQPIGFAIPSSGAKPADRTGDLITIGGEGHAIVSGATGTGKSSGILIPTLLRYQGPVIAVDIKGELAAATAAHRERFGPVHIVDPFRVTGGTAGLNALDSFDYSSGDEYELAIEIAGAVSSKLHTHDPFWDQAAQSLIARFVLLLGAHLPSCPARSLPAVRRLLHCTGKDLGELLAYAWMSPVAGGELQSLARMFDAAPATITSILTTAQTQLARFGGGLVDASLVQSSIEIADIIRGAPQTIYLVVPPDKLHSHGALLRSWLTQLLHLMFRRRGKVDIDTLFLIDEAAQLGELEIMPALYSLARGYSVRTVTVWQDLEQLARTYPASYRTMLSNAEIITQLGMDLKDAHATLTQLLGHPPRGRATTSTAHLAAERRAINVVPAYYFHDPELSALAIASGPRERQVRKREHPLMFDTARASSIPALPAIGDDRGHFAAMVDLLDRSSASPVSPRPLRSRPEAGFRALLRRLLGPAALA